MIKTTIPAVRSLWNRAARLARKSLFTLFFKRRPRSGEYCNSKIIGAIDAMRYGSRPFLVYIRTGSSHRLHGITSERNFDIALNHYARPTGDLAFDFRFSGGLSKFCAAKQFLASEDIPEYEGYIFLDDDLEMSADELSRFLEYCRAQELEFAQPSLTNDSFFTYRYLVNQKGHHRRVVKKVEVMMPYFSRRQLNRVLDTFDKSVSTWGLDLVWPGLVSVPPVVVDEFQARHVNPVGGGGFYRYLGSIGVSPPLEMQKLVDEYARRADD